MYDSFFRTSWTVAWRFPAPNKAGDLRGYCRDSFDQPRSVEKPGRSYDKPSVIVIKEAFQNWAKLSTIQHGTGLTWQCYYECGDRDFVSLS